MCNNAESLKAGSPADSLFDKLDLMLSPTVSVSAPLLSDLEAMDSAALRAYEVKALLRNTLPFSFLWWPSLSVPCGFTKSACPVGLQISARPGDDWRSSSIGYGIRAGGSITGWSTASAVQ